jgi:uncharacterized protein YndB with AHSA1/START domain
MTMQTPAEFWESRYADGGQVWSGRVNQTLVDVLSAVDVVPGHALDLGCGEGGDAVWLAQRGWRVTAVDISPTAVARGETAARRLGLADRVSWVAHDLSTWDVDASYDLVTASFFQAPVPLARVEILRRQAARVAPGGRLLVVSHAAPPPWASPEHVGGHRFSTPEEEAAQLALGDDWLTDLVELRRREVTGPDGQPATLEDGVLLLRRPGRSDVAFRVVAASPERVFAALVDPDALLEWLPPAGMSGRFESFDPRPGGGYRLVLTYDDPVNAPGKTTAGSDVVAARFDAVVPGQRLVQAVDFLSDDPSFAGTMAMTWTTSAVEDGTLVEIRADDVPAGISTQDHAAGMASSLEKLATYLERQPHVADPAPRFRG